jgi:hypothetical protein
VELLTYRLDVEALELGPHSRAVGVELVKFGTHEPVIGPDAAKIWAATLPALAGPEHWVLDFFAHVDRVREYCREKGIAFREPTSRSLVITPPSPERLASFLDRFTGEHFGIRAGGPAATGDSEVEGRLAARGIDAYDNSYRNYLCCIVCDLGSGSLTVLSERLWASEVIRRVRPALKDLNVEVTRPS